MSSASPVEGAAIDARVIEAMLPWLGVRFGNPSSLHAFGRDAAEAVPVTYTPQKAVVDMRHAIAKGAAAVWDKQPDNIAYDASMGDKAKVDAAFAKAAHVVKLEIENNRLITNYMETRGAIGAYDPSSQSYTLHVSSQGVHGIRDSVANLVLKIAPEKLRVVTGDVGGGFGTKTFVYREYPLVLEAAKILKRPVKWIAERSDHFVGDCHGRDNLSVAEVAMDGRGKFLAMRFDILGNLGAYLSQYGPYIPYLGGTMMTGVYKTPLIHVRVRGIYTHTVPVDAYRGAGRPDIAFAIERLVDHAAHEHGLDPVHVRRINFIPPEAFPYKTPTGNEYDSGDPAGLLDDVLRHSDYAGFEKRRAEARARGKLRGISVCTFVEPAGGGGSPVEETAIQFGAAGNPTIYTVSGPSGQGHETVFPEIVAQTLGLDPLNVTLKYSDPDGPALRGDGTIGSRSLMSHGGSLLLAAREVVKKGRDLAARHLLQHHGRHVGLLGSVGLYGRAV